MGLQHLDLDQAECAVTNLSDATALTYLELKLVEGLQWPTTLQRLQTFKLVNPGQPGIILGFSLN